VGSVLPHSFGPLLLAGLLYLSAELGLDSTSLLPCQRAIQRESHLRKADAGYLVRIVVVEKNDSGLKDA
jgi:hypothetical protein